MANAEGRSSSNSSPVIALAESLREALPPARMARRPAELGFGLRVRGTPAPRSSWPLPPPGPPREPARDAPWRLGTKRARQHRQPLPHGRGIVVDDVIDTGPAAL